MDILIVRGETPSIPNLCTTISNEVDGIVSIRYLIKGRDGLFKVRGRDLLPLSQFKVELELDKTDDGLVIKEVSKTIHSVEWNSYFTSFGVKRITSLAKGTFPRRIR